MSKPPVHLSPPAVNDGRGDAKRQQVRGNGVSHVAWPTDVRSALRRGKARICIWLLKLVYMSAATASADVCCALRCGSALWIAGS
jgi:hypothetical protein